MSKVGWDRHVADELLKAGYRALTKRYHPDAGGSHEEMLVLKATLDHMENLVVQVRKPEPFEDEPPPRQKREKPREDYSDKIPLEQYAYGWYQVKNTRCIRASERAVQVMFPRNPMPQWLPKSQLHKRANQIWDDGDTGTIVLSKWIAQQKGWL